MINIEIMDEDDYGRTKRLIESLNNEILSKFGLIRRKKILNNMQGVWSKMILIV
jgi:hypothetical protein